MSAGPDPIAEAVVRVLLDAPRPGPRSERVAGGDSLRRKVGGVLADAPTSTTPVSEGEIAAGVAADLARRIADDAASRGVDLDDLEPLLDLADRG